MQEYCLEIPEGKLYKNGQTKENQPGCGTLRLMSLEELKCWRETTLTSGAFTGGMCPVQYCKVEIYGECTLGTMKIPRAAKGKMTYALFGFYLKGQELLLVEDGNFPQAVSCKKWRKICPKTVAWADFSSCCWSF